MKKRLIRITLDWDFKTEKDFLKYLRRIKREKFEKIEIEPSPSERGYHLKIWLYTTKNRFNLRDKFGDDKNRIRLDKSNRAGQETLFSLKRKRKMKSFYKKNLI